MDVRDLIVALLAVATILVMTTITAEALRALITDYLRYRHITRHDKKGNRCV